MRPDEVAALIGVSPSTLRRLADAHGVSRVKVGGVSLYPIREVLRLLRAMGLEGDETPPAAPPTRRELAEVRAFTGGR